MPRNETRVHRDHYIKSVRSPRQGLWSLSERGCYWKLLKKIILTKLDIHCRHVAFGWFYESFIET